jgi:putative ABC transport system substrate-binding protein
LITRRDFTAGLMLAPGTRSAWAQTPAKQHRIVVVGGAHLAGWREDPIWRNFLPELRRLGHVEGNNLVIETFSAEGRFERYADVAHQAVSRNPDVVVAGNNDLVNALRSEAGTIPIVALMEDPLSSGLVTSLARRPGDNLTGVSFDAGVEIWGKRLELLKQAVPSASRIGILGTVLRPANQLQLLQEAGAALGVSLIEMTLDAATAPEIARSFAALAEQRADAALISSGHGLARQSQLIVGLAERHRLPAMYEAPIFAEAGGLMTYAPDVADLGRQLADDVRQILDGTKPGDIPIYQAAKFKLVINLKAANALGLTLPRSLLLLADEVIE